jgi:predicted  nucleic acid-binding Zn-ribbon protein
LLLGVRRCFGSRDKELAAAEASLRQQIQRLKDQLAEVRQSDQQAVEQLRLDLDQHQRQIDQLETELTVIQQCRHQVLSLFLFFIFQFLNV